MFYLWVVVVLCFARSHYIVRRFLLSRIYAKPYIGRSLDRRLV